MNKKTGSGNVEQIAKRARAASLGLARLGTAKKNAALKAMAAALRKDAKKILAANAADVKAAQKLVDSGKLSKSLLKRLMLDEVKIEDMARGVESVAKLPDPAGRVLDTLLLDDGLELQQVTCPIGVIGVVFESRPDALVQISSLGVKSGNAVILKGGSEAANSNAILTKILSAAAESVPGIPKGAIQIIETREQVADMLALDEYIDLIIPRGSNEFVRYIQDHTSIPVIGHADGICHVYVHKDAELNMALDVVMDAKTQYAAVCNAVETLLVDAAIAPKLLPPLMERFKAAGVEVRGCPATRKIVKSAKAANEKDWATEYIDLIISVKIVKNLEEAVAHINKYGSKHTEAIITKNKRAAEEFLASVDASCVFHNASTRFSDGYRFGKGAELGISTHKTHARGPVGLEGLVIYRYILRGQGHTVAPYTGAKARKFKHIRK